MIHGRERTIRKGMIDAYAPGNWVLSTYLHARAVLFHHLSDKKEKIF